MRYIDISKLKLPNFGLLMSQIRTELLPTCWKSRLRTLSWHCGLDLWQGVSISDRAVSFSGRVSITSRSDIDKALKPTAVQDLEPGSKLCLGRPSLKMMFHSDLTL